MGPLENLKHEEFARNLIETKSQQEAYLRAYPESDALSAKTSASRLLTVENVRQRVLELMNEKLSPSRVVSKLSEHLDSENEGISMDAVKTSLKVMGAFSEDKPVNQIETINIVFGDVVAPKASNTPNNNVTIEGSDSV